MTTITTIEVDSRGRTALGKVAERGTYKATRRPDGSVLLEPARVLTEAEIAVLADPTISAAIKAAHAGTSTSTPYDWE